MKQICLESEARSEYVSLEVKEKPTTVYVDIIRPKTCAYVNVFVGIATYG